MKKYISVDDLIENQERVPNYGIDVFAVPIKKVKTMPAANVAPIIDSNWEEYDGEDKGFHFCQHCHAQAFNYEDGSNIVELLTKHCYECGAKMGNGR